MNVFSILTQLRAKRLHLDRAIAALEEVSRAAAPQHSGRVASPRRRRRFSAATRKRMSDMMKKRWAARKKAGKSKL